MTFCFTQSICYFSMCFMIIFSYIPIIYLNSQIFNQQPKMGIMKSSSKIEQQISGLSSRFLASNTEQIVVIKEREKENDELLDLQHKEARKGFYLNKGKKPIQQIEEQFGKKKRECLLLTETIKQKLNYIKLIHIEYQLRHKKEDEYRYSISAFELFKVIRVNQLLRSCVLKGVLVEGLQEFIKMLCSSKSEIGEHKKELSWIKYFNPPNSLKLGIDTRLQFHMDKKAKSQVFYNIKALSFFAGLFDQVSNITANIIIGNLKEMGEWEHLLLALWKCLRYFKQIKIDIQKQYYSEYVYPQSTQKLRSLLFGSLCDFTQIISLSLKCIKFCTSITINDYLVMEQILRTLFKNNKIKELKLSNCQNLPIFPETKDLQSIDLKIVSFRKQTGFMRRVCEQNPSLRSVKCQSLQLDQEWRIDDQLFNQLQTLFVSQCRNITFNSFFSLTPSNVKHLWISYASPGNVDSLPTIFPKLTSITYLHLNVHDCRHQLLCSIPSPHMDDLTVTWNRTFTEEGLRAIDSKWPRLKHLTIMSYKVMSEKAWMGCKFKGLMEHSVNMRMQGESKKVVQQLRRKGVKFNYNEF